MEGPEVLEAEDLEEDPALEEDSEMTHSTLEELGQMTAETTWRR